MDKVKMIEFQQRGDSRGSLVVIEGQKYIREYDEFVKIVNQQ